MVLLLLDYLHNRDDDLFSVLLVVICRLVRLPYIHASTSWISLVLTHQMLSTIFMQMFYTFCAFCKCPCCTLNT